MKGGGGTMTSYRRKTPGWRRVVLLGLLLPAACNPQQAAAPASRPAVGVRSAELRGVNQSFQFVGHIKAVSKVDLRARVEGFFEQVAFREGHAVRTGGILYQIEKVQF